MAGFAGTIAGGVRLLAICHRGTRMTAPRAAWKGFLKVGSVTCGVKIVGATSEASKVHFKILNRKDGLPVKSAYIDEATEEEVEPEDQVKGFEIDKDSYIHVEPDELKKLKLTSDHTLEVGEFVDLGDVDTRYLEKPYYLIPADGAAAQAFEVIRKAMDEKKVAARSCVVLYQRGREVLIQPFGKGMLLTELRSHGEMISEQSVFADIKKVEYDADLIEIASLLIDKKVTSFDPSKFEDTYEDALIAMIEAKRKGKAPPKPVPRPKENVVNLAEILRKSLAQENGQSKKGKAARSRKRSA
ncbi:Ku protein [Mesorhizobium sp.]|uniref:non-homologous end joining protein Ku n=1 Tax=Mesorhizobium sp. TaxID=1871066 RepID=UPI00345BD537